MNTRSPRITALTDALARIGARPQNDAFTLTDSDGNSVSISFDKNTMHVDGGQHRAIVERVATLGRIFQLAVVVDGKTTSAPTTFAAFRDARIAADPEPRAVLTDHPVFADALARIPDLQRTSPTSAQIHIGKSPASISADFRRLTLTFVAEPNHDAIQAWALFLTQLSRCCDLGLAWFRVKLPGPPPVWVHRMLRSLTFRPEAGGLSYLRTPRADA